MSFRAPVRDLAFALLGLQGADTIDQPATGRGAPAGGVQQPALDRGKAGYIAGLGRPEHIGMTPEGPGGRTGRIQQHRVEGAFVRP